MQKRPDKNPYEPDSPEYQLFANAIGCEGSAVAFHADAERYFRQAEAARVKAARFWEALDRLADHGAKP